MKYLLLILPLVTTLATPTAAQVAGESRTITVVDSGTACVTAPAACAAFPVLSEVSGVTLSIYGTWTGTLTFEGTNNGGIWTTLLVVNLATAARVSTATASGLFGVSNPGLIGIRVRATAAITGAAIVTAARGGGQPLNATD